MAGIAIRSIVVVDSASTDGTAAAARRAAERLGLPLGVERCPIPGKGAALKHALRLLADLPVAGTDAILVMDADNATPLSALIGFAAGGAFDELPLRRLFIGSRLAPGAEIESAAERLPITRRSMTRVVSWLARHAVGLRVADSQCGFKLLPPAALDVIVAADADDGWLFDLDLLAAAQAAGIEVVEVPVRWREVPGSHVRPVRDSLASVAGLVGVAWRARARPVVGPIASRVARLRTLPLGMLVVFALALAAYATRMLNGVGFWDTGIFQTAPPTLSLTHPTGYPTYLLLGAAFTAIVPMPPAEAMTLLSALCGAAAVAGVYAIARTLGAHPALATAGALALGFSEDFMRTATRADAHTLHALFIVLLAALMLRWVRARDASPLVLAGGALVFGLALGNHLLTIMLAPALAAAVLVRGRELWRRPRLLLPAIGALLVGLSVYLYVPIRAAADPPVNHDVPPVTFDAFWSYVTGAQFRGDMTFLSADGVGKALGRLSWLGESVIAGFGWAGALFLALAGAIGLARLALTDRRLAAILALGAAVPLYAALTYENAHLERYLFTSLIVATVLAAIGGTLVLRVARGYRLGRGVAVVVAIAALIVPYQAYAANRHRVPDASATCYAETVMERVRPGAVVMSWWVYSTPLWYARHAVGLRPDVEVFNGHWEVVDELPYRLERGQPIYLVQPPELIQELALEHRLVAIAHDMCGVIVHELTPADVPADAP